jgi:hypothetical protein
MLQEDEILKEIELFSLKRQTKKVRAVENQ